MKKFLSLITAILLLASCGKENTTIQEEKLTQQEIQSPNSFFELAPIQDYLEDISESNYQTTKLQSPNDKNGNGSITSNEPVFNLAEDQTTCLDESGHLSITRTSLGARFNYHAKGLIPGETYLIYVVVISNNEDCDIIAFDAISLGEKKANPAGNLNLNTFLANGDATNSWYGPFFGGMIDSYQADLIVFARIGAPFIGTDVQISYNNVCSGFDCSI